MDLTPYGAFPRAGYIDMPIRMMGQGLETTKLKWVAKGLPWLILADKAHVVAGEGVHIKEVMKLVNAIGP